MQLQEQVISLEQAKKLKELGFERDSIYTHSKPGLKYGIYRNDEIRHPQHLSDYRAYTASELMDILPATIKNDKVGIELNIQITKLDGLYYISYRDEWNTAQEGHEKNKNLTIALGDMLIYLLENNLLPTTTNEA